MASSNRGEAITPRMVRAVATAFIPRSPLIEHVTNETFKLVLEKLRGILPRLG